MMKHGLSFRNRPGNPKTCVPLPTPPEGGMLWWEYEQVGREPMSIDQKTLASVLALSVGFRVQGCQFRLTRSFHKWGLQSI